MERLATSRRTASILAMVGGLVGVVAVLVRAAGLNHRHIVWLPTLSYQPTGFFLGRLVAVSAAYIAGPILLMWSGYRLRDDDAGRWISAAAALLGIGLGPGLWFMLLGLQGPGVSAFLGTGSFLVGVGVISGAYGIFPAFAISPRPPAVDTTVKTWRQTDRGLKQGLALAAAGSLGAVLGAVVWGVSSGNPGHSSAFSIIGQLVPPVLLLVCVWWVHSGREEKLRWQLAAGAWLGAGLGLGVAYLFVGVFYLVNAGSIVKCVSYLVVAAAGDRVRQGFEVEGESEEVETLGAGRLKEHHAAPREHRGPAMSELATHLRGVHGERHPPDDPEAARAVHERLHAEVGEQPEEGFDAGEADR